MKNDNRVKYIYEGPVTSFDKEICMHWRGETMASSEKAAKRNLIYQFKKENGMEIGYSKIELPDRILEVRRGEYRNG